MHPRLFTIYALYLCALGAGPAAAQDSSASPHWSADSCSAVAAEESCAACHDRSSVLSCRHANDLAPGAHAGLGIPDSYRQALQNGRITCETCHDTSAACSATPAARFLNPAFVRSGPFRPRHAACTQCHDAAAYPRLNPHQPLPDAASRNESCRLCHAGEVPAARDVGPADLPAASKNQCRACHLTPPHPVSMHFGPSADRWSHLVMPSDDVVDRLATAEREEGLRMPLDPISGEIICTTCHEPHVAGSFDGQGDPSADHRLRSPKLCEVCHDL